MGKKQKSKKPEPAQQEDTSPTTQSKSINQHNAEQTIPKNKNDTEQINKEKGGHHGLKKTNSKTEKKQKAKQVRNGAENEKSQHYRWEEVAKHDHKGDTWVVIQDNVYDVTKLLDNHPGGVKPILRRAGRNASQAFNDGKHPPHVVSHKLGKWKLGSINPESMIESWQRQTKTGKMDAFCSLVLGISLIGFMTYLTF